MRPDHPVIRKISFPSLPPVVPRKRLLHKLDQRGHYSVTWIAGMAGSGKTTLAAGHLARLHAPCLWYSIDEGDEDLATFFFYLGRAAQSITSTGFPSLPFLTAEYLPDVTIFSKRYFEALSRGLPRRSFLVFDDYHKIPSESGFHKAFRDGISIIRPDLHVLILSRNNPPAPFARMRANNRLRLIGQKDLKLTRTESNKIAEIAFGKRVPEKLMEEIFERTNGWAAGLILMAKSLKSGHLPSKDLKTLTPQEIFFYFADEVFGEMDAATKEFLLRSSVLPRMTADMAVELTGNGEAANLLASLERNHLFVEEVPVQEPIYQFHPLFREFLLSKAGETLTQDERTQLQGTAAGILYSAGFFEEAVDQYVQAGDTDGLMDLIKKQAGDLLDQGRHSTLEQWIRNLSEKTIQENAWALYWLGSACGHCHPAEARTLFEAAFRLFDEAKESPGLFLAWTGVVHTTLYEWNNFSILNPWIDRMEEILSREKSFPSPEIEAAVAVNMMSALMCCRPHHPRMMMWIEKALSLSQKQGDLHLQGEAADWAIMYFSWLGDFAKAEILKEETGRRMEAYKTHLPAILHWKWLDISTRVFYDIPDDSTLDEVLEALETIKQNGILAWEQMFLFNGVFVALILGNFKMAEEFLQRLQPILNPSRYHGYGIFHHCVALYDFLRGDTVRALEHARTALKAINETGYVFPVMICRYGLAMILIDQEDFEEAAEELSSAHSLARKTRSTIAEFMCLLGKAWLAIRMEGAADLERLKEAMSFGRKHAFQNLIWWWHPRMLSRLCAVALEEDIEVDYCQELVRTWNLSLESPVYALHNWPWTVKIHTLGRFEIWENGIPLDSGERLQGRPLELLKVLISRGGKEVDIEKIMDDLWPDAEGDAAHSAFSTNLNRLRSIFSHNEIVLLRRGRLTLNPKYCWLDTWVFEKALKEAERLLEESDRKKAVATYEDALALYKGSFMSDEALKHWAVFPRERLSLRYQRALIALGGALEHDGRHQNAIEWYETGLEANSLEETFYQRLMLCHGTLGRHADVVKTYRRCRDTLAGKLDVSPSEETQRIYKQLKAPL
jgi:LuxR family transcriptional regulator, maltose regulon positive regulatory protein